MKARPTTVLAIVAALVVLLAVVAAVVGRERERPLLDSTTPEGVIQLYVSELFRGNVSTAVTYLDPALGCTDPLPETFLNEASRIAVLKSTTTGATATVDLRIEEGAGFSGTWSHDETFSLRRNAESWLITGEPWPIYGCK